MRAALRQATAELHAVVDRMMPLARPAPSLSDYRSHLDLLLSWTRTLPRHPAVVGRLDAQEAVLMADLAACERLSAADPQRRAAWPQRAGLAADGQVDAAYAWGMAYVIEGSHLGGQVLYRALAEPLAPHPLDYLRGSGRDTGARWTAFLGELRSEVRTEPQIRNACRGAIDAFELLIACRRGLAENAA
ncbi:MAG: biliverdin-producing heme oxygenase [Variovorax sp.]